MPPSLTTEAKTLKPWTAEYRGTKSDLMSGRDFFRVGPSDVVDDPESPAVRVFGPLKNEWANLITSAINERSSLLSLMEDMAKALKLGADYDDLLLSYAGPQDTTLFANEAPKIDAAFDEWNHANRSALSRYTEFMEQNNA